MITKEIKDPAYTTIISGMIIFIFFMALFPLSGKLPSSIGILTSLATGVIYVVVLWFYFYTLSKEEVSRASPLFSTSPLFVLPFGFLFFGESFASVKYVGIPLVVVGAMTLSFKKLIHKIEFDKFILLNLFTALLFTLRSVLIKFATVNVSIWSILPWVGLGGALTSGTLFAFHHPGIPDEAKIGVEHLISTGVLTALAMVMFFTALSIGPISLVTALFQVRPLFVSISALVLSKYHSRFIEEKITRKILAQKMIATSLIASGGTLLVI